MSVIKYKNPNYTGSGDKYITISSIAITEDASTILEKLKTVDGKGSGLDADLFDGKDISEFVLKSDSTKDVLNVDFLLSSTGTISKENYDKLKDAVTNNYLLYLSITETESLEKYSCPIGYQYSPDTDLILILFHMEDGTSVMEVKNTYEISTKMYYNVEEAPEDGKQYVRKSRDWVELSDIDLENYLAKDNSIEYTPSTNYNPATKKYVDDRTPKIVVLSEDEYLALGEVVNSDNVLYFIVDDGTVVSYSYTVNSNIEGATVKANGEIVGTINGGTLTFTKSGDSALEKFTITLEGGSLPSTQTDYTFNVSVNGGTSVSVPESGSSYSSLVTSTKTIYSYSLPSSGEVSKNGSVTLNAIKNSGDTQQVQYSGSSNREWITYGSGNITVAKNSNTYSRSGTITYTQNESNKKVTVSFTQSGVEEYSYTVYSNIEGATVSVDGSPEGTISGGSFTFKRSGDNADNYYNITLSGGNLPEDSSPSYGTFDIEVDNNSSDSIEVPSSGGTYSITDKQSSKTYTRYSYPEQQRVNKNDSVTMNYVEESGVTESVSYSGRASQSWIRYSSDRITINSNSTSETREGTLTFTQSESGQEDVITFTQEGISIPTIQNQWVDPGLAEWQGGGNNHVVFKPEKVSGNFKPPYVTDFNRLTSLSGMFQLCTNLTGVDLSDYNSSDYRNVTDTSFMFSGTSLNSLDIGSLGQFDTSNVTNMNGMFQNFDYSGNTFSLLGFDMSKVTTAEAMFRNSGIKSIDLSGMDFSSMTNADNMFYLLRETTDLNLSYIKFKNNGASFSDYPSIDGWFKECRKLTTVDMRGWTNKTVVSNVVGLQSSNITFKTNWGDFNGGETIS